MRSHDEVTNLGQYHTHCEGSTCGRLAQRGAPCLVFHRRQHNYTAPMRKRNESSEALESRSPFVSPTERALLDARSPATILRRRTQCRAASGSIPLGLRRVPSKGGRSLGSLEANVVAG